MPGDLQLRLYRDALSTPWGFRLQGGKDLSSPLAVQKVTLGTPADGEMQCGDVVLEIQGTDTSRMTHLEAQEKIRNAGGSLLLRVLRFGTLAATATPLQKPRQGYIAPSKDFGIDYNRSKFMKNVELPLSQMKSQPGFMLSRVQESLTGASGSGYLEDDLSYLPGNYQDHPDIGWSSKTAPSPIRSAPPTRSTPPFHQQQARHPTRRSEEPSDDQPAWLGSLRSSGQPLPFDTSVVPQPHIYSPCIGRQSPVCRQAVFASPMTDAARAVHLQYNSPLGLYSKASAQESLAGQLRGTEAEGSLRIVGETDVYISDKVPQSSGVIGDVSDF